MLRTGIVAIFLALWASSQTPLTLDAQAYFRGAQLLWEQHNYQSAANELSKALQDRSLDPGMTAWAHTELGAIFDVTGQTERALEEYNIVLSDQSGEGTAARAYVMHRVSEGRIVSPLTVLPNFGPSLFYAKAAYPITRAPAEYSAEARIAELEGTVDFFGAVDVDGSVQGLKPKQGLGLGLDEAALNAAKRWSFAPADPPIDAVIEVDFIFPGKVSRWHLIGVTFKPPDGASVPHFLKTSYPPGAGVSNAGLDEAGFVEYTKRQAVVKLAFDVDAAGRPVNFQRPIVTYSSWGPEAVSIVRRWRFTPGMKDGVAVTTPCEVTLVWGNKQFTHESIVGAKKTAAMLVEVEALRTK